MILNCYHNCKHFSFQVFIIIIITIIVYIYIQCTYLAFEFIVYEAWDQGERQVLPAFFSPVFFLFCFAGYTKFYVNEHERLSNITLRQK